jgi:hypothetical protein
MSEVDTQHNNKLQHSEKMARNITIESVTLSLTAPSIKIYYYDWQIQINMSEVDTQHNDTQHNNKLQHSE